MRISQLQLKFSLGTSTLIDVFALKLLFVIQIHQPIFFIFLFFYFVIIIDQFIILTIIIIISSSIIIIIIITIIIILDYYYHIFVLELWCTDGL